MLDRIRKFFAAGRAVRDFRAALRDDRRPSAVMAGLTEWESRSIGKDECPDCGRTGFWEGPSGGCSTNIKCANPECGSVFNVHVWNGRVRGERISEPSPDKPDKKEGGSR